MAATTNLILPLIAAEQAQKHVPVNESLSKLDAIVQLSVKDRDLTAPPVSPAEGDRYIPASGATGAWAAWDLSIVLYTDGAWVRLVPREGWQCWVEDEAVVLVWNGAAWVAVGVGLWLGLGGATADATNRLSVNSPSVLFNNAGAEINVTLNKNAAGDDARFTFQNGFSTRAMFGLLGSDDFTIKVSADGASYTTAMVVDKDSGSIDFPRHPKCNVTSNFDNYVAANAWTKIQFNTTGTGGHNDQGAFDPATNVFVAPHAGYFLIQGAYRFKANAAVPTRALIRLLFNAATLIGPYGAQSNLVTQGSTVDCLTIAKLAAGDTVEAQAFFATNDGYVEAATCFFVAVQIV